MDPLTFLEVEFGSNTCQVWTWGCLGERLSTRIQAWSLGVRVHESPLLLGQMGPLWGQVCLHSDERICHVCEWLGRTENLVAQCLSAGPLRDSRAGPWGGVQAIPVADPHVFLQQEHWFEKALRDKKGFIIKQMKEDGACLFRAVGESLPQPLRA